MRRSIVAVVVAGVLTAAPITGAAAAGPGAQVTAAHRTGESWPVFERGDQNEGVRSLQYLLRGYRITPGTPGTAAPGTAISTSGKFDEATEKAVTAFESRRGLPETGNVDEAVWNTISHDITDSPIGMGYDNTEFVKAAQNMVNGFTAKCGNSPLTVDGQFGPHTYRAVTKVQKCQGQQDDGIVGPLTFHTLVANY